MDDRAQSRPVRGARQVVVDGFGDLLWREAVAEPAEQRQQLFRGEQIEQHQGVGLLGRLVVVDAVVLGLEDAVEPLDVAVPLPIAFPIKFGQFGIALELADHPVVEGNEHAPCHVPPPIQLLGPHIQARGQVQAVAQRQQIERVHGTQDHPHRQHVGVGVVVDPVEFLSGIT